MRFLCSANWVEVVEYNLGEQAWLCEYLSCEGVEVTQKWNPETYKQEVTREKVTQTVVEHGPFRFPAGLLRVVLKAAATASISIETKLDPNGAEAKAEAPNLVDLPDWLRDYQRTGVERIFKHHRGIIKAPTGSGKSEIAIAATLAYPMEWLFCVHRGNLVKQMMERYRKWTGEDAGSFIAGKWRRGTSNFTVSTFQSIARTMKDGGWPAIACLMDEIEGLIVDEVHAQSAKSFYSVSQAMVNAHYRIGLSATPLLRKHAIENMRTVGAIGPVIFKISTQRLIAEGILSQARVTMHTFGMDLGDKPPTLWAGVYNRAVRDCKARHELLTELAIRARKPCIMFVEQTRHGEQLVKYLKRSGVRFAFTHGKHSVASQRAEVVRLQNREIDLLLCTQIFSSGLDVPTIKSVINTGARGSQINALQQLGRGTRIAGDGDDTFEVWDLFDVSHKWLRKHANLRREAYELEGYEVDIVG